MFSGYSITETVNLATCGNCETEISSGGDYLYIIQQKNLISKFDLNSMAGELEQFLQGSETYLISSALSGNDSLLFVLDATGKLYKITTGNMAVVDTLTLGTYSFDRMEMRPGIEMLFLASDNEQIHILDTNQMILQIR